ncbi:MAG TPA: hypothetical protein VFA61_08695 [Candidatus Udaeobacter sp.]|nr:hypothetical protein [Candidatus Udaeobacter sp.]
MIIEDDKAAKIQELLKQLSGADSFQSVVITREIKDIATEAPTQKAKPPTDRPVAIKPTQR